MVSFWPVYKPTSQQPCTNPGIGYFLGKKALRISAQQFINSALIIALSHGLLSCSLKSATEHPGALYEKILPGSSLIDVSNVSPGITRYKKFRGNMDYHLSEAEPPSTDSFKLFIDFVVNGKSAPDTLYFDSSTLEFQSREFYNAFGKYTGVLSFKNNYLTGELRPDPAGSSLQESLVYNKEYEHPVFEPAMLNYLLGALPLEIGFTASLPMLDLNNGSSIVWANIEVTGKDVLHLGGKNHEVWKILSDGSRKKTFWISTSGNYFVKMKNQGVWFSWTLDG